MLIALAVCVQLGRQAFPLVNDYQSEITDYFSRKLGMVIELETIDASWKGLRPKLSLHKVVIKSQQGDTVFKIREAVAELSIINSLIDRRLSWRQLKFDGFDTRFVQSENGRWSIPGMPDLTKNKTVKKNKGKNRVGDPYDIFLVGRRVSISQVHFDLQYYSRETASVDIPEISIENDRDFHRIRASVDVAEAEAFSLMIEGHGDPRDENFVANGYLELNRFPTQNVVKALALSKSIAVNDDHRVNLKLWFRGDADKGTTLRGEIDAAGELSIPGRDFNMPKRIQAQLHGRGHTAEGWGVTLKSLQAEWASMTSPVIDVYLHGSGRKFAGAKIKEVSVKPWVDVVLGVGLGNKKAEEVVKTLSPSGTLKNVSVEMTDKASGYFLASAVVEKGTSNAVMGAPSFDNVNGYVSSSLLSGRMNVFVKDGFTIGLPKVYYEPLYFEEAQGQVTWDVDLEQRVAYISSGLIQVKNPEEEGKGYLHLSLPFAKKYGEQTMTLSIGIKNTLAKNHKKYVPKTIPKHLYEWLGTSIKKGRIANARFLYHGSLETDPPAPPSIQLFGEVYDGNLVFDKHWPELDGVTGTLTLDNEALDVRVQEASLLGNSVFDAAISLVDDSTQKGLALSIEGSLASDAQSAMTLLKNSPIKKHIGSTFDEWDFSGGVAAKVELIIPLDSESQGLSHNIDVRFSDANIAMPDLGLNIKNIAGTLVYQTEKGIFADKLIGSVWGKPYDASISTFSRALEGGGKSQDTVIDFSGRVSVNDLYAWTRRPELKFSSGASTVSGSINIPGDLSNQPLEVNVSSPLTGVELKFPEPFYKQKDEAIAFKSKVRFYDDAEEYNFTFDKQLRLTVLNPKNDEVSAKFEINNFDPGEDDTPRLENTGVFNVEGNLAHFDLEVWDVAKNEYFNRLNESGVDVSDAGDDPLPVNIDVFIDKFLLGTFEIDDLHVKGDRQYPFWVLNIESELMAGNVLVPEDDRPIALDLAYLRFEDEAADNEEGDSSEHDKSHKSGGGNAELAPSVLADIDLNRAVDIDFSSEEFSLGNANYGSWDFKLRAIDGGVVVHDIRANTKGMQLGSVENGAEFVWLKDDTGQSSQFSGTITANNLGDVFDAWGQDKLLESKSAVIDIDAQWPGAPDQVTLKVVEGVVNLDIKKGSFNRGAGSDENGLLRLLALFNFDTILRRLRLDFSDLASQGYSYDKIHGNLDIKDGKIYLTDPLIVESSSSYVQLVGTIDVVNEKLDSEMVVTLPLASSAAFATAIVVNLPAAIGLYVMSKMFKKQLDRASSLNVGVSGSWEDPKVKVKKIFDIGAAQRRGEALKEERAKDNQAKTPEPQLSKEAEMETIE